MPDQADYQDRFWKQLFQLRGNLEYLQAYHEDFSQKQTALNIGLAALSGVSLGLWAVFKEAA